MDAIAKNMLTPQKNLKWEGFQKQTCQHFADEVFAQPSASSQNSTYTPDLGDMHHTHLKAKACCVYIYDVKPRIADKAVFFDSQIVATRKIMNNNLFSFRHLL